MSRFYDQIMQAIQQHVNFDGRFVFCCNDADGDDGRAICYDDYDACLMMMMMMVVMHILC